MPELAAVETALAALEPLDESQRRRAVTWLAATLHVDLVSIQFESAIDCAEAAGLIEQAR